MHVLKLRICGKQVKLLLTTLFYHAVFVINLHQKLTFRYWHTTSASSFEALACFKLFKISK